MPTALLSVYDKTGVADLAKGLHDLGWRLLSSGGTARAIADAGLPVTDVADLTGYPAILGHRVVTLHPVVHGGLLADPSDPEHRRDLATHGIEPIDLVVAACTRSPADPSIELIDVGGPAMVRAAAKNHARVGVVIDRADYDAGPRRAARRRRAVGGHEAAAGPQGVRHDVGLRRRDRRLARRGRRRTRDGRRRRCRRRSSCASTGSRSCATARTRTRSPPGTASTVRRRGGTARVQHGGKELSYLNVFDTEAAWRLVHRFDRPACVIVKHANPCGVAVADDITTAYQRANARDPVSAFGGIVAVNRPVPDGAGVGARPGVHRGRRRPGLRRRCAGDADRQDEAAGARRRASWPPDPRRADRRRRAAGADR